MQRVIAKVSFLIVPLLLLCGGGVSAQGAPIGFAEQWALSTDREKVLGQLIPGTRDYYYYHCRHQQDTGAFEAVEPLLRAWIQRHGRTGRVEQIENRQALLTFDKDPVETLKFLQQRLGLKFDHQRQMSEAKQDVPSRLDAGQVSPTAFARRALQKRPRSTAGFKDSALEGLLARDLSDELLMSLLTRLRRPDVSNLPSLIVRNLKNRRSQGFGSLSIHSHLLLDQLEQCVSLMPALLNKQKFVEVYLKRLQPGGDVRWEGDTDARRAYLDRLHAFAQRLAPAHNSLKAHVLNSRLKFDLAQGEPDKARLMAYLRLPRPGSYVNPDYLRSHQRSGAVVDLNRGYPTGLDRIGSDEALVRTYLMHFFASEDSYEVYSETVRSDYLKRLFAETKILTGTGDMERWYSLLNDPVYYERLKERVEIEFVPTLKRYYRSDEDVSLQVDIKNVDTLLVKVFEINTFNYYQKTGKEVDASINLDGLIANQEMTRKYEEIPMRRVRRSFEFGDLSRPGVYVVEFIGNGLSSRAIIHKGRLQYTERRGAAGHILTVRDESGAKIKDASAWFAGRGYAADEHGEIAVPYSTKPGSRNLILSHGDLSTLERFRHTAEKYHLYSGAYLDRESLLVRQKAKIILRPDLRLNGNRISFEVLEDPVLTIVSRDLDGVASSLDVRNLKLSGDSEFVHEIQVPANLANISISLSGRVRNLSKGEDVNLAWGPRVFYLNAIDASKLTACPLLGRTPKGYVIDVLGKNGEPKAQRAVRLALDHEDYTDSYSVTLKTDAAGRIHLGQLPGITTVRASGLPKSVGSWSLRSANRTYPGELHGLVGGVLRVPYIGAAQVLSRALVSLLETRNGVYVRDAFENVALTGGFLELRGLKAGDYNLFLKQSRRQILVRVTDGVQRGGWAVGRDRLLETSGRRPLHIADVSVDDRQLRVRLANARPGSRVHVFATRYMTAYDPFAGLHSQEPVGRSRAGLVHPLSSYHSGREIGDEYRYILDRRFARKYPGNMLDRPGLILNRWALDESLNTVMGLGGGAGGRWGGRGGRAKGGPSTPGAQRQRQGQRHTPGSFVNLEFLAQPARVLVNLRADQNGTVEVPLDRLGSGQMLHVLAVGGGDTVYRSVVRDEQPLVARGRHLAKALDSEQHFAERRSIDFVKAGGSAVLDTDSNAQVQTYDSLTSIFRLFSSLNGDAGLSEFAFVLKWPAFDDAEKRERYETHACHELHFFLYQKDRKFFDRVVLPYLASKAHKTFMDEWLLGLDLSGYLDPWAFARLNIAERALLARRLSGQSANIKRHIQEVFDLKPRDAGQLDRWFLGALRSQTLDDNAGTLSGKLGLIEKGKRVRDRGQVDKVYKGPGDTVQTRRRALAGGRKAAENKPGNAVEEVLEEEEPEIADSEMPAAEPKKAVQPITGSENFFAMSDLKRRADLRELYRAPGATKPFVEHNYWHRRNTEQLAGLIRANGFWRDFAVAPSDQPFLSSRIAEATSNVAEMMLALSVLDVPFESQKHDMKVEGAQLTLRTATPLLLVRKELVETKIQEGDTQAPILVSQNYFRLDEPYRFEGNQRYDAYVSGEYLVDVAYGCRVVVTNPTSAPRQLDLLLQIPQGAIPVNSGFYTKGVSVDLGAYGTTSLEYAFYFPAAGTMPHYPVHVAKDGSLVAFANAEPLVVVNEASKVDTTSWQYVSQNADSAAVLAYLDAANLQRTDLKKIAWRMRDAKLFGEVVDVLRKRHAYSNDLWSYGVLHRDSAAVREYLRHQDRFLQRCGRALNSTLVSIDPIERHAYQHIEYEPLFNARAHQFGKQRKILNDHLSGQYRSFLAVLGDKRALGDEDWMSVTYYLLVQDRVEEALASFARVRPTELPMRVQYDYMRAYLDLFTADYSVARRIAQRYADYPITRWRELFAEVATHLDEAGGTDVAKGDPDSRTKRQSELADQEPSLEMKVEAKKVTLAYRNVADCEVRYYEMDVEFLFSTNPFVQQGSGSFSYIKPNHRESRDLPGGKSEVVFDLPQELQNSNVLVEVRSKGVVRRQPYYANSLAVRWIETYGQLKVANQKTGKPLSTVYVKVFARMPGGKVRFYKDGYTDIRGRFDYASLSSRDSQKAERYSILVMSDDHGAMIREVAPPAQ